MADWATIRELRKLREQVEAGGGGDVDLSEIDAAIDALETSVAGKQSAATAATDAELASGLATKQDSATAATDAELAAAVAAVSAAIQTGVRLAGADVPASMGSGDVGKALVWSGSGWVAAPTNVFDYVESNTDLATNSLYPTFVDLSNFTVNVPATPKPAWLEFHAPISFHNTAGKYLHARIVETTNSNALVAASYMQSDLANAISAWTIRKRIPASASPRTYKMVWSHGATSGGGGQLGLNVILGVSVVTAYFRAFSE